MYTLVRSITLRDLVLAQAPALLISMAIAEMFYKFHSFTLETMAFLGNWFVVDGAISLGSRFLSKHRNRTARS